MDWLWLFGLGWLAVALGFLVYRYVEAMRALRFLDRAMAQLARREINDISRPDGGGRLTWGVYWSMWDVQATIKTLLLQTQEMQNRWRAVTENMEEGIVLLDLARRVAAINPAATRLLDVAEVRVLGRPLLEMVLNLDLEQAVKQALAGGRPLTMEVLGPGQRELEVALAPLLTPDERPDGLLLVLRDISRFRRLERMRADFVANVSHELQTPITAIKGFAETLLDDPDDSEAVRRFGPIIAREADRMGRLIDDLLELSRLENSTELHLTRVQVAELVQRAVQALGQRAEQAGIEIAVDVPASLSLRADADRLYQVLVNLLTNAIKYTPGGGRVHLAGVHTGAGVHLSVQDTGVGLAPEHVSRIFERFYRVDKARGRASGGTGLGLAICKHIVERHQGRIWAESPGIGQGTTIHVVLPETLG